MFHGWYSCVASLLFHLLCDDKNPCLMNGKWIFDCPPLLFYLLCPKTSQSRNGGCVLISNGWKLSYLSTTVSKSGPPTKTSVCTISQGRQRRLATKKREIFRLPSSWAANKMEDKRKGIHTKAHWNRHLCHLGSPLIREVAVSNFRWSFSI